MKHFYFFLTVVHLITMNENLVNGHSTYFITGYKGIKCYDYKLLSSQVVMGKAIQLATSASFSINVIKSDVYVTNGTSYDAGDTFTLSIPSCGANCEVLYELDGGAIFSNSDNDCIRTRSVTKSVSFTTPADVTGAITIKALYSIGYGNTKLTNAFYLFPRTNPPTSIPTKKPTRNPTVAPSRLPRPPTNSPTITPTNSPTITPTDYPTITPTDYPTIIPTEQPSSTPTFPPTELITSQPTAIPIINLVKGEIAFSIYILT